MLIRGRVLHATTGDPIGDARIMLRLGEREVSTHSRPDGAFEWRDDRTHSGGSLEVSVEAEGFESWRMSREIRTEEAEIEIRLDPVGARTVTTAFIVRDEGGTAVPGAEVVLSGSEGPVGSATTDADGAATITVAADAAEDPVSYVVKKEGYRDGSGEIRPGAAGPVELVIREEATAPPVSAKWLVMGAVGILAAVLVVAWAIDQASDGPNRRRVEEAEAVTRPALEELEPRPEQPEGEGRPDPETPPQGGVTVDTAVFTPAVPIDPEVLAEAVAAARSTTVEIEVVTGGDGTSDPLRLRLSGSFDASPHTTVLPRRRLQPGQRAAFEVDVPSGFCGMTGFGLSKGGSDAWHLAEVWVSVDGERVYFDRVADRRLADSSDSYQGGWSGTAAYRERCGG